MRRPSGPEEFGDEDGDPATSEGIFIFQGSNTTAVNVGDIVRVSETDFRLVECFDPATNTCTLTPSCRLKQVFSNALQAYFRELDGVTLADLMSPPASATAPAGREARTRGAAPVRVALPKRRAA